jgi:hypothetical protein
MHQMKTAILIAGLAACCGVAHAVVTPYTADFGTGPGQEDVNDASSDFVVLALGSTVDDPTLVTQTNSLRLAKIADDDYAPGYAAVATDLSAAAKTDFSVTSTITMGSVGGEDYTRFGFLFLGNVASSNGLTAVFYPNRGDFGEIRIRDFGFGGTDVDNVRRTSGSVADGSEYTFTLNGAFNEAGDLTLNYSVVNADGGGSGDLAAGTILAGDLPSGNEFGVAGRVRDGFSGDYANLTVIPEPGTFGLIGACAIGAFAIRRFKM